MILGISGDSPFCHTAFHKAHPLPFLLLSDVHRTVIAAYGVHDVDRNVAYVTDRPSLTGPGRLRLLPFAIRFSSTRSCARASLPPRRAARRSAEVCRVWDGRTRHCPPSGWARRAAPRRQRMLAAALTAANCVAAFAHKN